MRSSFVLSAAAAFVAVGAQDIDFAGVDATPGMMSSRPTASIMLIEDRPNYQHHSWFERAGSSFQ
jgi:hypothetical protein